jgi:gliding motility-associated-like protein
MSKIPGCFFILIFLFFSSPLKAQSCFNINAGKDTAIACSQPCLDLKARVPDVKTTDDYSVVSIPYNPYPYTSPLGNELTLLYQDDKFSGIIDLPFTFCFYGKTYNQVSVGSNGVFTFDVATNAGTDECYVIAPGNQLFYSGGAPNDINTFYAPRASIFLAYVDMDPRPNFSPPDRKIEWRLEGTAPCRKLVISYYHIDTYHGESPGTGACIKNYYTMQAVLYEGTGLIDVFYETKPACTAYQSGLAIAGLQNWNQDETVTLPFKNGTVWTANSEAYRYVPNGSSSLLNRVELYRNNLLISTGSIVNLGTGELEATFSNICQAQDSMSYVVKAFYQQCDNPLAETEGSDTMIVYKSLNPVTSNIINPACAGNNGSITVTSPVAPDIEYSIDAGITWQTSNIFSKPAGNYIITARLFGSNCKGTATAIIDEPLALNTTASANAATCAGKDGIISISAIGGTPAYQYSIDNGVNYQASNVFTIAPGNYNSIKIKDANGCISSATATVILDDQMFLNLGADTSICVGNSVNLLPQTNPQTDTFRWAPATFLNNNQIKDAVSTPVDTIRYSLTAKWGICQRTDDILIKVLHKPVVYAGKDSIICYKAVALLKGDAVNLSGAVNYAWSPATNVTPANFRIALAKPDTTQLYTLTVTDNYGCNFTVSDDVLITMRPKVPAFAGNDTNAIYGVPHQMLGSGGLMYNWSPATALNNPFAAKPLATLYNDTYFTVVVTDDIGCVNTDDVFIKVYKGPTYYVPNAFTPNADGDNDIFRAIPVGISLTNYFNIYNRFGELVFQTNQWLKGWDGTIKGKKAAAGTYVWIIKGMDRYGQIVEMKGAVVLIR